jgi:Fe2+ transport system protein FeoA
MNLTLNDILINEKAKVINVIGDHKETMYLINIGFRKDLEIEVRRNDGKHPIIIAYGVNRMAVTRNLAKMIQVERIKND